MVSVGGLLRTVDFFRLSDWPWRWLGERSLRRDCLCARVLDLRSVARSEAVTSGDGASPKMKNLMKTARMRTTESWPSMRPCVKENLFFFISVSEYETI